MLKNLTLLLLFVGLTATSYAQIKTPQPSPAAKMEQVVGLTDVSVEYSRPAMRGRTIFGDLVPYGEVWRTGANEAPELVLYKDFNLNGTKIKAGSYSLLTIPGEKEWTIILNSDINTWGSYYYNEKNDVARITVPTTYVSDSLEAFSIVFDGEDGNVIMHIGWDTLRVSVPFTK